MPSGGGEESINTLKLSLAANPNDPFAWYALGVRCYVKKLPHEALQCFEKAESCKTNFSAANYYYIALTQRVLGKNEECLANLRKAIATRAINAVDKKARVLAEKMLAKLEGARGKKDQSPSPTHFREPSVSPIPNK